MRTLLMALMIAGLRSTVGVYAAAFGSTPTAKALAGGTGTVSAPNTGTVSVKWTTDSAGDISAAVVTWTPAVAGDYDISVTAGGSFGTLNIPSSGTSERTTDSVPFSPAIDPALITDAKVSIEQN